MRKNLIITALIFIIPIIAYAVLSENNTVSAQKHVAGQPHIVKFSSKLCLDCKKIKQGFEELAPQYQDKIVISEYNVEQNDADTKNAITKYDVSLVPTIVFVDKNGKEVRRTEGFVETSELKKYFDELLK